MKKILMLMLFCGFGLSTYMFGQSPSRVPATPYPINFCYAAMNNDNEIIASKYKVGKRGICVRRYLKKISKSEKLKKTIL